MRIEFCGGCGAPLEALGHRISGARPVLQRIPVHDLNRHIECELEIPVRLTAHGPTAPDRRWIQHVPPW